MPFCCCDAQLKDLRSTLESRLKENWSSETVSQQARERVGQLEAAMDAAEESKQKAIGEATALKQAEADNARLELEHVRTKLEQANTKARADLQYAEMQGKDVKSALEADHRAKEGAFKKEMDALKADASKPFIEKEREMRTAMTDLERRNDELERLQTTADARMTTALEEKDRSAGRTLEQVERKLADTTAELNLLNDRLTATAAKHEKEFAMLEALNEKSLREQVRSLCLPVSTTVCPQLLSLFACLSYCLPA
jgi:hypothetical protein